jgi:hypothetical protein
MAARLPPNRRKCAPELPQRGRGLTFLRNREEVKRYAAPPFRKRSGFFDAPSDAADQLDETRPTLHGRSFDEVGRLAGVLA